MPIEDDAPEFRGSPLGSDAARWAARRMDRQRWTASDEAEYCAWLERSPDHAREMAELDATLGLMGRQEHYDDGEIDGILKRHAPQRGVFRFRMSVVAMMATVVVGLAVWFWLGATETFFTGVAERREVVLKDGTLVKLDAGTRLKSFMWWWGRRVELTAGEAVFTIAEDPSRPFMVSAGECEIRDIGTVFSVQVLTPANNVTGVEVAVREGAVEMSSAKDDGAGVVKLSAGESAAWDGHARPPIARAFDPANFASWREGRRHYVGRPLRQIMADLQRYTQDRLELHDDALAEMKVSGTLSMDQPDKAFDVLRIILPLKVVRETGRIVFEREARGKKTPTGSVR